MLKLLLFTMSFNASAIIIDGGNFTRELVYLNPADVKSESLLYKRWRKEINPFIPSPYAAIYDKTVDKNNELIYEHTYHTEEYGMRIVPGAKKNLPRHLIVGGDSNAFGVGCADDQTLPFYLSKIFPDYSVINFGLGGTAAHSSLRFLEIFNLKDMFPQSYKKGIYIYDFHDFHIQRIIGSKSYLEWSATTPRYTLDSKDIPVYDGPWSESWQKKFYSVLDLFPYSKELFPELPRIDEGHIELSARIILALKNKYLEQTSKDNRFIVFINPGAKPVKRPGMMIRPKDDKFPVNETMIRKLRELNVEVVSFKDEEILDLTKYELEGHFQSQGHKNYAQMISKKIKVKN